MPRQAGIPAILNPPVCCPFVPFYDLIPLDDGGECDTRSRQGLLQHCTLDASIALEKGEQLARSSEAAIWTVDATASLLQIILSHPCRSI